MPETVYSGPRQHIFDFKARAEDSIEGDMGLYLTEVVKELGIQHALQTNLLEIPQEYQSRLFKNAVKQARGKRGPQGINKRPFVVRGGNAIQGVQGLGISRT